VTPKRMVIKVIDQLFVVVYGTEDPSDAEWRGYLDLLKRHGIERTRQLIFTDGGEPNATQRHQLNDLLAGRALPVAVISTSPRVRATVEALSWFNGKIRAFPAGRLPDALEYLEVPASRTDLIEREIRRLRSSLGLDDAGAHGMSTPAPPDRACRRMGCLLLAAVLVVVGVLCCTLILVAEDTTPVPRSPGDIGRRPAIH
jgi:hypothetical protein